MGYNDFATLVKEMSARVRPAKLARLVENARNSIIAAATIGKNRIVIQFSRTNTNDDWGSFVNEIATIFKGEGFITTIKEPTQRAYGELTISWEITKESK